MIAISIVFVLDPLLGGVLVHHIHAGIVLQDDVGFFNLFFPSGISISVDGNVEIVPVAAVDLRPDGIAADVKVGIMRLDFYRMAGDIQAVNVTDDLACRMPLEQERSIRMMDAVPVVDDADLLHPRFLYEHLHLCRMASMEFFGQLLDDGPAVRQASPHGCRSSAPPVPASPCAGKSICRRTPSPSHAHCDFMVVGGEQRLRPDMMVDVFKHRLGQGHAVIGRGAPSNFIEDEEAVVRRISLAPDAGEYLVEYRQHCRFRRDIHAHLGHDADDGNLTHIGTLAGHVRSCDQIDECILVHVEGVRHIRPISHRSRPA